jgi:energy-coupling factor transport system substrate-specific component
MKKQSQGAACLLASIFHLFVVPFMLYSNFVTKNLRKGQSEANGCIYSLFNKRSVSTVKKLKVQDLIAIGIYTAIYFLLMSVCLLILRFVIPGFHNLFIPAVSALFSGVIYLILLNKVPKFGAITIMGTVVGLFFLISGHFPLAFLPNMLCALAADLILYRTKLAAQVKVMVSYIVFSFGLMGPILPLWLMKNAYIDSLIARGKDEAYINGVFAHTTTAMFVFCAVAVLIGAIVGLFIGSRLYDKHFRPADQE